ncbi:MAG: hypothetical protein K5629_05410 [Eubacteriales bacterium]|nr:hypothetical protein [Eubacteriales bacterium]
MDSNPGNEKKKIVLISKETLQKKNDQAAPKKNEAQTERTARTVPSKAPSSGTRRTQSSKPAPASNTRKASSKARPAAAMPRTASANSESKLPETSILREASPKKAAPVPKNGTKQKKPTAAVSASAASKRGNDKSAATAETASRQTKTRPRRRVTKKLPTVILMTLVMLIIAACVFIIWERTDNSIYLKAYDAGQTIAGDGVEVTFLECSVMNELLTYPLDPNYVYVKTVYVVRNTLSTAKDWHIMPYLTLAPYTFHEGGYLAVPYENAAGTDDSEADVSNAYIDENFYGVFDFNVLQIFGLERGIDFTDIKADLEPGATRTCADVFRIKKELFDDTVYFIGIDTIPGAIVRIGSEDDIGIWEFDPESNTAIKTTVPAGQ